MEDLRAKTIRASGWMLGSRVISQAISFAFGVVLARLLMPDDYGLIAMVVAFSALGGLLSDVGLGSALVQKKNTTEAHFSSVFWLNIIIGCLLGGGFYFASSLLSDFYARPEVENICKVTSIAFVIGSIAMVPRIKFTKELFFKYIAFSDLISMIVSGVIAIAMAANGFGYWSLVALRLSQVTISTAIIYTACGWRPKTWIDWSAIKELYAFGFSVFGTGIIQHIGKSIDKIMLGKFIGGEQLGLYDKAHSMMLFPLQNISHVIGSVMFPALSIIQSDIERVRSIYLRCISAISLITFPVMTGLFVVAEPFVIGVLGSHWSGLVPVLRIFCVAGALQSILTVTGSIYKSQGAVALQFKLNLIMQPLQILGVIAGLPWGIIGVAIGYTVAQFINGVLTLTIAGRLIGLKLGALLSSLLPTLLSSIVMAIFVSAIRPVFEIENDLFLLLVQIMAGVAIYWCIVAMMQLKAYKDITGVIGAEFLSKQKNNI